MVFRCELIVHLDLPFFVLVLAQVYSYCPLAIKLVPVVSSSAAGRVSLFCRRVSKRMAENSGGVIRRRAKVSSALEEYSKTISSVIEDIKSLIATVGGVEIFSNTKLGKMMELFQPTTTLWKSLEVCSKEEFDGVLKEVMTGGSDRMNCEEFHRLQEAVECYFEREGETEKWLESLDRSLNKVQDCSWSKGETIPDNIWLESLECPGKSQALKTLVTEAEFTWLVFLRHFS